MGAVLGTLISRRISPLHAPVQSTSSDFVRMKRRIRAELGCGCAGLATGGWIEAVLVWFLGVAEQFEGTQPIEARIPFP